MSNPRIVRALELIHQVKTNINDMGLTINSVMLGQAEDELLRHVAELKRAERIESSL